MSTLVFLDSQLESKKNTFQEEEVEEAVAVVEAVVVAEVAKLKMEEKEEEEEVNNWMLEKKKSHLYEEFEYESTLKQSKEGPQKIMFYI